MKKIVLVVSFVLSVLMVSAPATAASFDGISNVVSAFEVSKDKDAWLAKIIAKLEKRVSKFKEKKKKKSKGYKKPTSVPEIDGGHAGLALALLAGIFAFTRERKKRLA